MNFSTDRDLFVLEPNVFRDVPFASQQRLHAPDGVLSGTALTSATADFESADVDTGGVVLIDDVACEVIARVSAGELEVSQPRTALSDAPIPPASGDGADLDVIVRSFAPQAAVVRDMLLRLVGIEPDDLHAALTMDAVVSVGQMVQLEALGTLERIYSAAAAVTGDNANLRHKAGEYRKQFGAACRAAVILLDTDGDGRADVRQYLSVVNLVRS